MADEERSFNYNDLNLDFLELTPPRKKTLRPTIATVAQPNFFRPSALKAKQLAQRIAQNDVLVNKVELLKKEYADVQQKLKDFQTSALQIQNLYEDEKKKYADLHMKFKSMEIESKGMSTHLTRLEDELAEKNLQLEQVEAQLDNAKGPISYTELSLKYLKLLQKLLEEDDIKLYDKQLISSLTKFCEDSGHKVPVIKAKVKKKRIYKKDKDVQCNLLQSSYPIKSTELHTQSTQTVAIQCSEIETQTTSSTKRDIQTQTLHTEMQPPKCVQSQGVQTIQIELHTQGTQHISTTTTRGTSTSCFIKKHNVGTCFPEPKLVPPVTAMVDELLQLYNVSPLSPISDPISQTALKDLETSFNPSTKETRVSFKSIGTCTYLCNIQRQVDFIPTIKRSQSSSPAPFICDNVKREAYATPTSSPPPPTTTAESSEIRSARSSDNLGNLTDMNNMQPMFNAFTQLPDMQPETFSTIWQMAGQMFMGLLYPPTNNGMRLSQLNITNNSHKEQFHNWLYSLYQSMQQPQQQTAASMFPQADFVQPISRSEGPSDLNNEINANIAQPYYNSRPIEDPPEEVQIICDRSVNPRTDHNNRYMPSTDESTQTESENHIVQPQKTMARENEGNVEHWVFKEPREIPKKSVKQASRRKMAAEEQTYMKKCRDKQTRKKRKKKREKDHIVQATSSTLNAVVATEIFKVEATNNPNEEDFATAVEFCAKLCRLNNETHVEINKCMEDNVTNTLSAAQPHSYTCEEFINNGDTELQNTKIISGVILPHNEERNKVVVNEHVDTVPDAALSDSEESNCDNLVKIEALSKIEFQQKIYHNHVKEKGVETYDLFGSDSEEENRLNLVDSENIQLLADDLSSEEYLALKNSGALLYCKEIILKNESDEEEPYQELITPKNNKIGETLIQTEEVSCVKSSNALEHIKRITGCCENTTINDIVKLDEKVRESGFRPLTESFANEEVPECSLQQILLDLSMSESEEDNNSEENLSDNTVKCALDESEEADESKLVIDEGNIKADNISSEFSVGCDQQIDNKFSKSPPNAPSPPSGSDTDVSVLFEGSILDDILANTSTQQLVNSILSETASEQMEADTDLPRRRGHKRKNEMSAITLCKRSERLRAMHCIDNQTSSDECTSPPTKSRRNHQHKTKPSSDEEVFGDNKQNFTSQIPVAHTRYNLLKTLTKEQIEKQYQRFTEMKQRSVKNESMNSQNINSNEILTEAETSVSNIDTNELAEQLNEKVTKRLPTHIQTNEQNELETPAFSTPHSSIQPTTDLNSEQPSDAKDPFTPNDQKHAFDVSIDTMVYESPASPPLPTCSDNNSFTISQPCPEILLERSGSYYSYQHRKGILQHFIKQYSYDIYATVTGVKKEVDSHSKIAVQIEKFLNTTRDKVDVSASTLALSLVEELNDSETIASLIVEQIRKAPRPEIELNCEPTKVPPKYIGTHLRLISIVLRHIHYKRPQIASDIMVEIEKRLFNYKNTDTMTLDAALNLTQLYLLAIRMDKAEINPARLFVAKCLYYHCVRASPMIYEVLCWYPTTLPRRHQSDYDQSDALITVIQHLLMCTTYNMDSTDLRHKELLSLLRFEYYFEPFQPKALEVLSNLVAKLKSGKVTNLKYAFAIFCKRNTKLVEILLQQQLLPLAEEYYKVVQHTEEYDKRIACLLECISVVVKPLPLTTDITIYHTIFGRFLGAVHRPVVQEAAVLAILRLQRFGSNRCFHALIHFKPHYPLQMLTINALKTFIHRKPLDHWRGLIMHTTTTNCS
ncbi:little elongation complex subunit 1 [Ceratitis capitata]|uniref:little elongation complex subunit 1 n=1 Tax=Ceratitis capitata TaxID=7213 RepID=UPI0003299611|nr:little elongation complex subunit 1 [Ceratitis capitata]